MKKWVIYDDRVGQVISNSPADSLNVKIEVARKNPNIYQRTETMWVPVEKCTFITKEVADIINS